MTPDTNEQAAPGTAKLPVGEAKPRAPQKSGVVVPQGLKWHGRLAAFAIFALLKALTLTWRVKLVNEVEGVHAPVIFCIWHNRLAITLKAYYGFGTKRWPAPGLAALISASKDGALLAGVMKWIGITPVRGSSSRRGRQALLEMTTHIQNGFNAAITPDGPRGPKYAVQEGIIALAQITGATIVPVSAKVSSKWTVKSWDAFQVPKPFARIDILLSEPMRVPREATDEQREALRVDLQRRMLAVTID